MLQYLRTHTWLQLLLLSVVSGALFTISALQHGWMNEYYSAAAQAGATGWKAFFYVSFDSANALSIDKPPLGIWPSSIAVALFGFSWLAIAAPHIIAGIGTTLLLYLLVRKIAGERYGLLTVILLLSTPIVSVIFGYNQPDSILLLLLTASLYTFYIFLAEGTARWLIVTAVLLGLGAMTKSLQVIPLVAVYGAAFLWIRKGKIKKDSAALIVSGGVFALLALWWPLIVSLTPPSERPYIGSTTDNSPWSLLFGYNGVERLTNSEQVRTQDDLRFGGEPSVLRLYNEEFGPNSGWYLLLLIPAAIGMFIRTKAPPRSERRIVGLSLGWALVYGAIISGMHGIVHGYYSSVLAVPVALCAAFALKWSIEWYVRKTPKRWAVLPLTLALTGFMSAYLLHYSPTPLTPYAPLLAALSVLTGAALLYRAVPRRAVWALSLGILLVGPVSFSLYMLSHTQTGPFPSVRATSTSVAVPAEAIAFLEDRYTQERWIVATEATGNAAAVQLSTGKAAFAIGGYNGTDPIVTVSDLEAYVQHGELRYFMTSASPVYSTLSPTLRAWIETHDTVYQDEQVLIYDLTK